MAPAAADFAAVAFGLAAGAFLAAVFFAATFFAAGFAAVARLAPDLADVARATAKGPRSGVAAGLADPAALETGGWEEVIAALLGVIVGVAAAGRADAAAGALRSGAVFCFAIADRLLVAAVAASVGADGGVVAARWGSALTGLSQRANMQPRKKPTKPAAKTRRTVVRSGDISIISLPAGA